MLNIIVVALVLAQGAPQASSDPKAVALAKKVIKAYGGDAWPKVKRAKFNFVVEVDGEVKRNAAHDWDIGKQTDTIVVDGAAPVTLDLTNPNDPKAFERWTNDTYWLLKGIKLNDAGTIVTFDPLSTPAKPVLHLAFGQVGLTPSDQYRFYLDAKTMRVSGWDYVPADKEMKHFDWVGDTKMCGMLVPTDHPSSDGKVHIKLTNVDLQC